MVHDGSDLIYNLYQPIVNVKWFCTVLDNQSPNGCFCSEVMSAIPMVLIPVLSSGRGRRDIKLRLVNCRAACAC